MKAAWMLNAVLMIGAICSAQTNPKNVPKPPTAELQKFEPFLGKYAVSGDFANLPWTGTIELKKVIKGWYIEQIVKVKSPGIDREFWVLSTWDKSAEKYRLWGFATVPAADEGDIRFENGEMITEWPYVRPHGAKVFTSNRYHFLAGGELEIVSYVQVGGGPIQKIGTLRGKRLVNAEEGATAQPADRIQKQIAPAFHGFWTLDVEKNDFGNRAKPKTGFVNWGEHGWTIAIVQADGGVYADAVETSQGCTFIGVTPNDLSCVMEVVTPRYVRLTLKQGATIRRIGDIELLEDGTTRTIHHVTPSQGAPYVEKTIWEKQVRR